VFDLADGLQGLLRGSAGVAVTGLEPGIVGDVLPEPVGQIVLPHDDGKWRRKWPNVSWLIC
jgi:hypothetical protein